MGTKIRAWMAALAFAGAGLALVALPAAPAAAEPAWRFEPESANVGDTVAVIGSGWPTLSGDVSIFAPDVDAADESSAPLLTVKVDEDGGFTAEGLVVPTVAGGRQSFGACQYCSELNGPDTPANADAFLTVLPRMGFDPADGLPEAEVGVGGSGWLIGPGQVFLFGSEADSSDPDNLIQSYDVQDDGTIVADSRMAVPGYDAGSYTFFACQQCGDSEKVWGYPVSFKVDDAPPAEFDPELDLAVDGAAIGQNVIVEGNGWSDAAGDVSVYADQTHVKAGRGPLARAPVDGGTFTTKIRVPETEANTLSIFACQECGRNPELTAEQDLDIDPGTTIVARLSLSDDSGSPGTDIHAIGTGWADGEVQLFAGNDAVRQRSIGLATAKNGTFEADLKVPDIGFGPIEVVACQQCGTSEQRRAAQSFTVVKAPQTGPSLTLDREEVRSEGSVHVSGAGWSPDDGKVTVFLRRAGVKTQRTRWFRVSPEPAGTFDRVVQAPQLDAGNYLVVACQRCRAAPGFPRATRDLMISADAPNWLLVGGVAGGFLLVLVAALVTVRHLRRRARPRPKPPVPPRVLPHADPVYDVQLRGPPGGAHGVEVPRLDVVAHPDPARLADQVEVST